MHFVCSAIFKMDGFHRKGQQKQYYLCLMLYPEVTSFDISHFLKHMTSAASNSAKEMLSPSLGPILPPAVEGLEDDDFLPPQDGSNWPHWDGCHPIAQKGRHRK